MAEYVHDRDGDHLRIFRILHGPDAGSIRLRIQETGPDGEERGASLGPVDPVAVIAAVRVAAGMPIEESPEAEPVSEPHAPATAEAPRPWTGADEPIIDQIDRKSTRLNSSHVSISYARALQPLSLHDALPIADRTARSGGPVSALSTRWP